jgi:DNA polymerase bacteriophage-type
MSVLPHAPHDFETGSAVDLRKANADVYFNDASTRIHCMAWAIGDGPISVWYPGAPDPVAFLDHIWAGGMLSAWNSYFEESAWIYLIPKICPHWPVPATEQFDDTMARAMACSMPGGLDDCAVAAQTGFVKDKAGSRIMMKWARPINSKRAAGDAPTFYTRETHPDDFEKLCAYCGDDVEAERQLAKVLPPLIPAERQAWLLDQRINRRGIKADTEALGNAITMIGRETARLNSAMARATADAVPTITAIPKLKTWLNADLEFSGIDLSELDKPAVKGLLANPDLPDSARTVLTIRQEAGRSSTAKFQKMQTLASVDGRIRGEFAYHRATTGRWQGRGVNLLNLVRPRLKASEIAECIELFKDHEHGRALITMGYGDPFDVLAWSVRGMIIPKPGHVLLGGDFSNIEGRMIAWLAGETWKLQAFRDYDAGTGHDLYKLAYAKAFGVDPDSVDDDQRQIGKVMELALGFGGGVGAFLTMAAGYGANLYDIAQRVKSTVLPEVWDAAEKKRLWLQVEKGMHAELHPVTYTGLRVLVDAWRVAHPAISTFWPDMEAAAMTAIIQRGTVTETATGLIKFVCGENFLYCKLPSGRIMYYARPSIELVYSPIFEQHQKTVTYYAQGKEKNGADKTSGPKKFAPVHSYGGLLAQNATQGAARDILRDAMFRLEAANYPIVLHVYDEARAEAPQGFGSAIECAEIMGEVPAWADGLPIAVECEALERYHK